MSENKTLTVDFVDNADTKSVYASSAMATGPTATRDITLHFILDTYKLRRQEMVSEDPSDPNIWTAKPDGVIAEPVREVVAKVTMPLDQLDQVIRLLQNKYDNSVALLEGI